MSDTEQADTIPAPPVPSTNPVADLRRALDESVVALRIERTLDGEVFVGIRTLPGSNRVYEDVTPPIRTDTAIRWLLQARSAIVNGTMQPEFCERGHLKDAVGLCGTCLRGGA